jgi:predicted DNA binding CopG/RHH family protein
VSDIQSLLSAIRFRDPANLRQASDLAGTRSVLETKVRKEYDFSKSRKNPYASQLKRQITIRLDTVAVDYFKKMAAELGMPYQNLINLFLRDCAANKRRPSIQWAEDQSKARR